MQFLQLYYKFFGYKYFLFVFGIRSWFFGLGFAIDVFGPNPVGLDCIPVCLYDVSEWMSSVECLHQHIIGHIRDESFQSISCSGTDN